MPEIKEIGLKNVAYVVIGTRHNSSETGSANDYIYNVLPYTVYILTKNSTLYISKHTYRSMNSQICHTYYKLFVFN